MPRRLINIAGFLACVLLLAYGYYLQYYDGLEPCPLCIFQRVALFALGIVFLIAALHNPRSAGAKVYGVLLLITAGIGTAIAGRHVWLQNLPPDEVPECGPALDFLMDMMPLTEVITTVLKGDGNCAEVSWRFLSLSIPAWTLLMFVLLGLIGLIGNWRRS